MKHIPYSREPFPEGWTRPRPPGYYERGIEAQRKRRAANPEKVRELGRKTERRRKLRKYGLTEDTYKALLLKQNEKCAICFTTSSGKRDWHIDHCHATGKVRGLLCHHCNLLLGNARDNIDTLKMSIWYLEDSLCGTS